jgi:hypothetical protein
VATVFLVLLGQYLSEQDLVVHLTDLLYLLLPVTQVLHLVLEANCQYLVAWEQLEAMCLLPVELVLLALVDHCL